MSKLVEYAKMRVAAADHHLHDMIAIEAKCVSELLAHIERLEKMQLGFTEDYKKWWKANVEISFDQWINFESTHWTGDTDAAYQAWQHLYESVVYPMQKNIERLEAESQGWQECAAMMSRNADFYQGIVRQIGEMFGEEAKTSDDGSVQSDVLALKVPELVPRLIKTAEQV